MRLPHRRDDSEVHADQAMTPMIDLVFLLLVFFICASVGRVSEQILPTELAGTSAEVAAADPEPDPLGDLWVHLVRRGDRTAAEVNGVEHPDLAALAAIMQGLAEADAAGTMPVILDIDPPVPAGDVIAAYDAARAAGFASVSFAADRN